MPRPKVLDSQRQRAAEACSLCRETKKKCSGTAPCTQCQRRGLSRECFMTHLPRGFRMKNHDHRAAVASRFPRNHSPQLSAAPAPPANIPAAAPARNTIAPEQQGSMNMFGARPDQDAAARNESFRPLTPSESREENDDSATTTTQTTTGCPAADGSSMSASGPRMLLTQHGERVYIGAAASIAFLQIVRRVVAGQIGPSDFSHSKENEKMLEIETPKSGEDAMEITVEQKLQFLQTYFAVTEAFIDIFDPPELEAWITNSGQGPLTAGTDHSRQAGTVGSPPSSQFGPLRQTSLDLVVAIGAQCTANQDSQDIGRAFFRGAQKQALANMIQDPDLDMVRTYLLMAFYMIGDCRRNTAYLYLSVAARAAIALGLHSPSSYSQGQLDAVDKLRLRVWTTCRVGDRLVNSLLGRPATTVGIPEELGPVFANLTPGCDFGLDCMIAAYKIVSIIDDINTKLYSQGDVRPEVIEKLLQAIDDWKDDLPPTLKQSTLQSSLRSWDTSIDGKQGSIGVVHVSCLYYFAVMLASRPMFISALTLQRGEKDAHSPIGEACLDAALYLAQICAEALEAGLLGSQMCIMKALVFAAGLVLGVEIFAQPSVNYEIERAFEGSKAVLAYLATRSPQASHYLDILTSLSNAIAKQKSRMEPPGRASQYVSRLFSLGSSTGDASGNPADQMSDDGPPWTNALLLDDATMADIPNLPTIADSPSTWGDGGQVNPEMFIDWETVNISHWDNFPFRV